MTIFSKSSDQRGALMVEAIALLGLMTMISPMIVRQTAERTTEMEDVAVAGQMKTIKDSLENYIRSDYTNLIPNPPQQGVFQKNIEALKLAPFLPASYIDADNNKIRGNKLAEGFDVGVRGFCTEKQNKSTGKIEDCTLGASCECTRYKIVGMIVSKSDTEIPDKRAARVASMLGADGGYMRTKEVVDAISATPEGATGAMKKVLGAQGMWEVSNIDDYVTGTEATKGGRIVMSTVFSSGLSADYLYRKHVNGIPDANSMFTDLDMGGNGACKDTSGDGNCNRINNAGGLEVIDGKLIVREKNGASGEDQDDGTGDSLARIALGVNWASMQVKQGVAISAGTTPAAVPGDGSIVLSGSNNITADAAGDFSAQGNTVEMQTRDGNLRFAAGDGSIAMEAYDAASGATDPTSQIAMNSAQADIKAPTVTATATGGDLELKSDTNDVVVSAANLLNMSGADVELAASNELTVHSDQNITVEAEQAMTLATGSGNLLINSGSNLNLSATNFAQVDARLITLNAGRAQLTMGSMIAANGSTDGRGDATSGSPSTRSISHSKIVGGLTVDSEDNNALTISDAGKATVVLQKQGLTIHASTDKTAGMIQGNTFGKNDITIAATADRGGVIALGSNEYEHSIELVGKTGTVHAGVFEPKNIANASGTLFKPVRNTLNATFDSSGKYTGGNPADADADTFGTIVTNLTEANGKIYNVHGGDTTMNKFRVNPAFTSVMNDIKITSRGGARLSEALPNYILKGIYDLNNTYAKGPWPCSSSCGSDSSGSSACCTYELPKKSEKGFDTYPLDDFPTDGGNVTNGTDKYTVNLYSADYAECGTTGSGASATYNACLAHPFLGVVPAPGRQVSIGSETMGGMDEGVCPDGYVAAMTITPYQFEVGKVNYIQTYQPAIAADTLEYVAYMQWNWSHPIEGGIFQPATAVGIATEDVIEGGVLKGWKVAMGTIGYGFPDPDQNTSHWIWNYGGNVMVDSMKAYAQTYCYFNPSRFTMPNMRVITADGQSIVTSMDDI